jgi:hypothetical protein
MSDESRKISREELYRLVWSKPTRNVAREFGISDVGVGKICKRLNVQKPPRGYWQRIASGYKVKTPALPSPGKGGRTQSFLISIVIDYLRYRLDTFIALLHIHVGEQKKAGPAKVG